MTCKAAENLLVAVRRGGHKKERTEVFALMKGRAETSRLVLLEAQTGSAKAIAKYVKDGHRTP